MSDNSQKTHYARTINKFAEDKVQDALQALGKALPCYVTAVSGSIVTVKFAVNSSFTLPEVTCPAAGPEYIRYPIQVNDLGVVMSADYYLGGVSGLGGGVADLTLRANLSTLIFFPIANTGSDTTKNWPAVEDPDASVLYGPNGVIVRTADGATKIVVSKTGITIVTDRGLSINAAQAISITSETSIALTAPTITSSS